MKLYNDDMDVDSRVRVYKSLADRTRLAIVRKLAEVGREADSGEIVIDCAEVLELSQPTISHHFVKLVNSGVLHERKVGTKKYYSLDRGLLKSVGINSRRL